MKTLLEYQLDESFGLLIEGPPKTGKTTLALQFPDPWIADCSNNLSGAIRWFRQHRPDQIGKITYSRPWMFDDGTLVPEHCRWAKLLDQMNEAFRDPTRKTFIIDDIGVVCEWLQFFIVNEKNPSKKESMTIGDWVPFRNMLGKLITDSRLICRNKRYFIVTAHEEYAKDERTGEIKTRVNIPSKMADNFGGSFSDVWRSIAEETGDVLSYKVRSMPTTAVPALGNSLGLPKEFVFSWNGFEKYFNQK